MSGPSPRVSVIVVSWNGREHLRRCLAGLARQTYESYDVVVVDNGSSDGTADFVLAEYPKARLIRNPTNLGFAAGNNVGIRSTDSPYLALLNNDAVPAPEWLGALVRAAEADPSVGSVASKMVFAHDPSTVNSCGIALDPVGIAWDLWGGYPAAVVDRPREVFGPCAGAALYRRSMLDDVGLFDEDYFAYLEDVDLAWRARLRGWQCVLEPAAVVHHAHAGTLGESSPLKRFLLARNKVWTVAKCAPSPAVWAWLPAIVAYDVGAALFGVVRQGDWASLRGRWAALRELPGVLAKRRAVQARRTAPSAQLRRHHAPLALPWEVPRRYRHLVAAFGQAGPPALQTIQPGSASEKNLAAPTPRASLSPGEGPAAPPRSSTGESGTGAELAGPRGGRGTPPGSTGGRSAGTRARRLLLWTLGWLGRGHPARQLPPAHARIVVFRPDHLGDVLLARPALAALVEGLPEAEVTVVAGPWAAPALAGLPVRIATFAFPGFTREPKRGPHGPYLALLAFACRLRRERYDAAVVLRPDHWWGALAAAMAGIPLRVGHAVPEVSSFLTHRVPARPGEAWGAAGARAVGECVRALGGERVAVVRPARYQPSPRGAAAADRWLRDNGIDAQPLVVIHPGAGVPLKSWPAGRWAALCREVGDARAVLSGGSGEEDFLELVRAQAGEPLPVALGLSWDTLAGLYRRARVVVGMDSGPLHLATAVGTPTVRIYGPTDPRIFGPDGDRTLHRVVQGSLHCVPCGNLAAPPCGYREFPPCLASASLREVVDAVRELVALTGPGDPTGGPGSR